MFARADDTDIAGKNLDPSLCFVRNDECVLVHGASDDGPVAVDFGAWEERRKIPKL